MAKTGNYYLVGSDGKAPKGLNPGDYVVTNGGLYQISGFNDDGSYKPGTLINKDITAYNYGNYGITISKTPTVSDGGKPTNPVIDTNKNITDAQDYAQKNSLGTADQRPKTNTSTPTYAGYGSTVTNYGEGSLSYDSDSGRIIRTMPSGAQYYVDPGDEKYDSIYNEYVSTYGQPQSNKQQTTDDIFEQLYQQTTQIPEYQEPEQNKDLTDLVYDLIGQLQNNQYKPADTTNILNNAMSYDEAYELATSILTPQYKGLYDQAAVASAQNLDRAGLINSLYGQQLQANAQNRVSDQLMAAIPQLALELQGSDRDWAKTLLQSVVDENRYAFESSQNQLTATASAALSLINSIANQAATKYDYDVSRVAQQIKQQANILEAQYQAGVIEQQELETELLKLELEAQKLAASNKGSGVTGGDDEIDVTGSTTQQPETVGNTDVAVGNESYTELAKNIKAIYDSAGETSAEQFTKTLMQGMTEAQREAFAAELEKLGL